MEVDVRRGLTAYIPSIGPGPVSKAPFQSILLSCVINLLVTKIAQDLTGEILALSLFSE